MMKIITGKKKVSKEIRDFQGRNGAVLERVIWQVTSEQRFYRDEGMRFETA